MLTILRRGLRIDVFCSADKISYVNFAVGKPAQQLGSYLMRYKFHDIGDPSYHPLHTPITAPMQVRAEHVASSIRSGWRVVGQVARWFLLLQHQLGAQQ